MLWEFREKIILKINRYLLPKTIITDVGSSKEKSMDLIKRKLKKGFIPYWNRTLDLKVWKLFYDDLLKVKTTVHEINGARILFTYEMFNEKNELVNTGETILVFISKATNRPCAAPGELVRRLEI